MRIYSLVLFAFILLPIQAWAVRVVSIDVNGISILGTSSVSAYCVGFTDAGPPVTTNFCGPITIPVGSTPAQAAAAIEAGINGCLPIPGVTSVTRTDFMVDVFIDDDADSIGFECADVPDHTITFGITGLYLGAFSKGSATVSQSKVNVPDNDRTCQNITWSVTNTGGAAFPAGAEVTWDLHNLTQCAGQIDTAGAADGLAVGNTVGPFNLGLHITSNIPNKIERGRAFPRPNFDPPFDDPQLDDFELEEGVPPVPSLSVHGFAIAAIVVIGTSLLLLSRRRA